MVFCARTSRCERLCPPDAQPAWAERRFLHGPMLHGKLRCVPGIRAAFDVENARDALLAHKLRRCHAPLAQVADEEEIAIARQLNEPLAECAERQADCALRVPF